MPQRGIPVIDSVDDIDGDSGVLTLSIGAHHGTDLLGDAAPVSYTHLDVYKRQNGNSFAVHLPDAPDVENIQGRNHPGSLDGQHIVNGGRKGFAIDDALEMCIRDRA